MASPRRRFDLSPRGMTDADCAFYLGRSPTWFMEHRARLEAAGFPPKLPLIGTRDRKAIDTWLDRQGGLEVALQELGDPWVSAASRE
jgi:hypothetical protein